MAVALAALSAQAGEVPVAAVFYYLIGYTVLSLGAFAVLQWFESVDIENIHLDDLAGIAKKYPWAAFALTVFMFSFAGFPPTVGFIAKFFVFAAALQGGLYALVVLGVIGSMISMFYYLRVIMKMYFAEPIPLAISLKPQRSMVTAAIIAVAVILTFVLGIVTPGPGFESLKNYGPQIGASAH
jgi:NADH-quinone oxidoreductase subunit N